jgi:hypothetical protein
MECRYGKHCYRKNPEHFQQFAHPWLQIEQRGWWCGCFEWIRRLIAWGQGGVGGVGKIEDNEKISVMASVVIGTAAAWGYRNEGKAAYFNVAGGELHMGEEMYEGATEGTVLMLSDTLVYDELVTQLRHGDIVDFGNYRGCGCFCVEPVDASCSDFFLWKTGIMLFMLCLWSFLKCPSS